jgi:NADH-quinone oxidoreductase subunit F
MPDADALQRPLTAGTRADGEPASLAEYEAAGGYAALRRTVGETAPADLIRLVRDSGLRGRGGAGFPTGAKWGFVPQGEAAPRPRYLLVNADELEPGTFKDRWLLERNPHLVIEGTILAAYAIQAEVAYVFVRRAYSRATEIVRRAIGEARAAGYLGPRIRGGDFGLALHLHASAGRYICGEETALTNALEGRRATPRAKPPFPPVVGLWGRPTIVNNVETLCNLPGIVRHGAAWFLSLGCSGDGGTKLYGVSGRVRRPGLWELPMGTPLREILETHAGGMREGFRLRGLLPGGASTDFLTPEHLDLRMDFASVQAAGSRLGTGTMVVLDDRTCPVGMVHNLIRFFARESCGWCTPCREGLPWLERILAALEAGDGREEEIAILEQHGRQLAAGATFCALAPGAMEPLQSALKHFGDDFRRHVRERRCPWGPSWR